MLPHLACYASGSNHRQGVSDGELCLLENLTTAATGRKVQTRCKASESHDHNLVRATITTCSGNTKLGVKAKAAAGHIAGWHTMPMSQCFLPKGRQDGYKVNLHKPDVAMTSGRVGWGSRQLTTR